MSSAWECFHRSMYVLVGSDSPRERLVRAYTSNLMRLTSKDVPAEIRTDFDALRASMASTPPEMSDHPLHNVAPVMDDRRVVASINAIIRMYDVLARYQPIIQTSAGGTSHSVSAGHPEGNEAGFEPRDIEKTKSAAIPRNGNDAASESDVSRPTAHSQEPEIQDPAPESGRHTKKSPLT